MTGTFDNWSKSERLERVGQVFQKTVTLPDDSDKIYYKVSDAFRFVSPLEFLVRVRGVLSGPWTGARGNLVECLVPTTVETTA